MNVLIDICVVPMGVGVSVSKYVVECQRIFEASGLSHEMHSYGTNVEGEWDKVMAAVKACHEKMHEMGSIASKACATSSTASTRRWKSSPHFSPPTCCGRRYARRGGAYSRRSAERGVNHACADLWSVRPATTASRRPRDGAW
jgi:uncharacterized protein (TIGR00106 family)